MEENPHIPKGVIVMKEIAKNVWFMVTNGDDETSDVMVILGVIFIMANGSLRFFRESIETIAEWKTAMNIATIAGVALWVIFVTRMFLNLMEILGVKDLEDDED